MERDFRPNGSELVDLPFSPEDEPKLDAIVVLGKNIGVDWTKETVRQQRFHLSPHARINVLAAGIAYEAEFADKIIFSTGKTAGKDIPSEAQLMKDHLQRIFKDIPDDAIILEENSLNTDTNAVEVKKLLDKYNFDPDNVALVTVGFHLERAEMLFNIHGMGPHLFASEELLRIERRKFVENYLKSELVAREIKKEAMAMKIQSNVVGRLILRQVTKMTRG